jgi:hypothetical protein
MKRYIRSSVQPAMTEGTIFYRVSLDDIIKHFSDKSENAWILKSFEELGWNALNFHKHLYDSFICEDDLFICVTDGKKIRYNDKFMSVDKLPKDIDLDELSPYIAMGNDQIIHRYITPYELKLPKFTEWSADLEADGYKKEKLRKDAKQFK